MAIIRLAAAALCALVLECAATAGTVIYVDDDADPSGNGSRWQSAYVHLQDALVAAEGAVPPVEIRVAQGVYQPDRSAASPAGTRSRDATFLLRSQVTIRGGYAGVSAGASADEHDPARFPTILSGDLNGDDGPDFTNMGDNSYHVVVALNVGSDAVLDSCTVRSGRADGPGFGPSPESREQGAAVNIYDASPVLRNCIFERNWMLNHGTVNDHGIASRLENCTFRDNFANSFGAGLYIHFHSRTHVVQCRFENNISRGDGGGLYNKHGGDGGHEANGPDMPPTIDTPVDGLDGRGARPAGDTGGRHDVPRVEDCVFVGNSAVRGGGMYNAASAQAHVDRCRFEGNVASDVGGGIYGDSHSAPVIAQCEFLRNEALTGGGLYLKESATSITDSHFEANRADFGEGGGGAWLVDCAAQVLRCAFIENVGFNGAGLYNGGTICPVVDDCDFVGNLALNDNGGGMSNVDCGPLVTNCRFFDNQATTNSDNHFVVGGGVSSYLCDPVFVNCDFRGNTAFRGAGAMFQEGGVGTVIACRFWDNEAYNGGAVYSLRNTINFISCAFWNNRAHGDFAFGGHTGGAIHNSFETVLNISNCTFYGNSAQLGGALASYMSWTNIEQSILWGDSGGEVFVKSAPTTLTDNIVQGGWTSEGAGNLDSEPRWVNAPDADFRLLADSPAIDAGTPEYVPPPHGEIDAGGLARIANCVVDWGAFEFDQPTQYGDVNLDGGISPADVGVFVEAILGGGSAAARCRADMNGDGAVTVGDIGLFVAKLSQ